jgi:hypothetical protein
MPDPGSDATCSASHASRAAELRGDVGDHPIVGGGGAAQHRYAGREQLEHRSHPPVVGAEVVTPVADAVGFIDHQQAGAWCDDLLQLLTEPRVVEPLR